MLHRLHNWHCLTMPNMHIWCPIYFGHKVVDNANCADNAFYAGALQCHLCRQCQLCAWDTVFLKLNFHPVNFHFMHIWHCLWHFLGLKYAKMNSCGWSIILHLARRNIKTQRQGKSRPLNIRLSEKINCELSLISN